MVAQEGKPRGVPRLDHLLSKTTSSASVTLLNPGLYQSHSQLTPVIYIPLTLYRKSCSIQNTRVNMKTGPDMRADAQKALDVLKKGGIVIIPAGMLLKQPQSR